MSDRHRTLLSIRRRDRADAVERLNQLLDVVDDLTISIDQTYKELRCTETELTRPTDQECTTGFMLSCELNHRQALRQRLVVLKNMIDKLTAKRAGLECQILEAKDDVARKQQAFKATSKHQREL